MKKKLLFLFWSILFCQTGFSTNLLNNGGFETYPLPSAVSESSVYSLTRLANFFDTALQSGAPVPAAGQTFVKGAWYVKCPNSGYFRLKQMAGGYSSDYSLLMELKAGSSQSGMNAWKSSMALTQRIAADPSQTYKISFYAKKDPSVTFNPKIVAAAIAGVNNGPSVADSVNIASTSWTRYDLSLNLAATASSSTDWAFVLSLLPNYDASNKTLLSNVYIDQISVDQVPLPSPTAYTFGFEEAAIPPQWRTADGSLSFSPYFQEGTQSLCWTTPAKQSSSLTLLFPDGYQTGSLSAYFNCYNSVALPEGMLKVDFLDQDGQVVRSARMQLYFTGWREFDRSYTQDYGSNNSSSDWIAAIRFTLTNPSATSTKLYFDNVKVKNPTNAQRVFSDWMLPDYDQFSSALTDKTNIAWASSSYPNDLPLTIPTPEELNGLSLVRSRYSDLPLSAAVTAADIDNAMDYITGLNLIRNGDGWISGPAILAGSARLNNTDLETLCRRIEVIAQASKNNPSTYRTAYNDYIDYVLDQGILWKADQLSSSSYSLVINIARRILNAYYRADSVRQKDELLRVYQWLLAYGQMYEPSYSDHQNSDIIYNNLEFFIRYAVLLTDPAYGVRELKAVKRYLERATEYTEGGLDILKPDGTGFHHGTHYNNYMYAYKSWATGLYNLRGTSFQIDKDSYLRFKKAVVSMCLMATRGSSANLHGICLSGRNPFDPGTKLQFSISHLNQLTAVGGDLLAQPSDPELDALSAYLFSNGADDTYDGFYAYNYSPLGIYRHKTWVASMRAPTTKFFGAEIYSGQNRFGRYQSHGALEILYNDKNQADNGYPSSGSLSGWDWNVVPGTTTVYYTSWTAMNPGGSDLTKRFDQFTKTKNFAGALSFNDCGIFGADFDQIENWGSFTYTSTQLVFKKSVYAFEGKLISLGSNIGNVSVANTSITATNLFQSYSSAPPFIRGVEMNPGTTLDNLTQNLTLLTPQGTGYVIPTGNDPVQIMLGSQSAPNVKGTDIASPGSAIASKAFIKHGTAVTNKGYHFVVLPAATPVSLQALSDRIGADGGDLYKIQHCDGSYHALTYYPLQTTAYSFFGPVANLNFGKVLSVGSEMLLMQKDLSDREISLAVCNPNLRPVPTAVDWKSSPTVTQITLFGLWQLKNVSDPSSVSISLSGANTTVIDLTLSDGFAQYITLNELQVGESTVASSQKIDAFLSPSTGILQLRFYVDPQPVSVYLFDAAGKMAGEYHLISSTLTEIDMNHLPSGVYTTKIVTGRDSQVIKVIK